MLNPDSSASKHEPGTHTIIVNGREKTVDVNQVTYQQVLLLAYPNPDTGEDVSYTITWARNEHGEATGKLLPGGTEKVNEGMIFNVKRAVRS
jgi:Multiubiquitin